MNEPDSFQNARRMSIEKKICLKCLPFQKRLPEPVLESQPFPVIDPAKISSFLINFIVSLLKINFFFVKWQLGGKLLLQLLFFVENKFLFFSSSNSSFL